MVCGGGTGGHIYPALAIVAELRRQGFTLEQFLWIGTRGQMEEQLVPRAGINLETIEGGPIVGVALGKRLLNGGRLFWSLGKVMRLLRRFRPDVLLMTGGYVNVPVAPVARLMGVPAAIFLPDIEPGTAIRRLSRFAKRIACTAAESRQFFAPDKAVVTGYPVRPELREALSMSREEALALFDLHPERGTIFVFGGSRGARSINFAVLDNLDALLQRYQLIHVTGDLDWPAVAQRSAQLPENNRRYYRPYAYFHEQMGAAFRSADLVVARAGASMLGEAPTFGVPSVLVPYPHAWRYQKVNADYLVERGAAMRLNDERLATQFLSTISTLMDDEARLSAMGAAAKELDKPQAAFNLAKLLRQLAERG